MRDQETWDWQAENWPLGPRHRVLPKWAREEIKRYRLDEINREMADCVMADVRELCRTATGINCTFADDDVRLMAVLASRAVDAGLFDDVGDSVTRRRLTRAAGRRRAAQGIEARQGGDAASGSVHESPVPRSGRRPNPSTMIPIQGERK